MKKTKNILTKASFDKFCQYIKNHTGIYMDDSKHGSFRINPDARMDVLDIRDYENYYSFITGPSGKKEFFELLNLVLIKETFFFRDEYQLKVLIKYILPELIQRKNGEEIKIWSAGCATGEEPYSIALSIAEHFSPAGLNFSLYATDISQKFLKQAQEGIYHKSSMRAMNKALLHKYFTQQGERYYLQDQIKQRIQFNTVNLMEPFEMFFNPHTIKHSENNHFSRESGYFDVIFCKNVIIYFTLETIKAIIHKFYNTLTPEGVLFIGHSESLWQISDEFELEEFDGVFFYRKRKKNKTVPSRQESQQKQVKITSHPHVRPPQIALLPQQKSSLNSPTTVSSRNNFGIPGKDISGSDKSRLATPLPSGSSGLGLNEPQPGIKPVQNKNLSEWIKQRLQLFGGDNYEAGLETIEKALQDDPQNADAHLLSATLYANMGLYDKALKKCTNVLEINNLSADAYLLMGSIYYKIREKEKAVSAFKKSVYLDETSALSHYYLGNLYKDSHLIEHAIKAYKNAIRAVQVNLKTEEWFIGEVFTAKQLKEICNKNIDLLLQNTGKR